MMSSSAPETDGGGARMLALAGTLVVLGTVLTVFIGLTAEFGGTPWLVLYVGLAFAGATLLARRAPTRVGVASAVVVICLGLGGYVVLLPPQYYGLFSGSAFVEDTVGWLTGRSVVLMLEADLWALAVAPGPVLLTWYLAVRGRYDGAALAGGTALGFFVLTGDLGEGATLVGMAGLFCVLGAGAVATSDGSWRQLQEIGLVVGLALLLSRFVRIVPAAGRGGPSVGRDGGGQSLEQELLSNPDRMEVGGRPSLSAAPRFTVEAQQRAYWHTRSFDHYGGQAWRRTDTAGAADRPLDPPPSGGTTLKQSVTVESTTRSMPAAWKPVLLGTDARALSEVAATGNLEPTDALEPGTRYDVVSEVPVWTEDDLTGAVGEYSRAIEERYTQLPGDLPDRLVAKTEEIVSDADGPYETALAIQEWLGANKEYSIEVYRRNWDIADAFVFALDSGYCVYFATAMAVMARIAGVATRFVVGYGPGEVTDDGSWLVRGYNSHAWVEVYFEDVGWVTFDPTPSAPRRQAQQRKRDRSGSEGAASTSTEPPGTETPTATEESTVNGANETPVNRTNETSEDPEPLLPEISPDNEVPNGTPTGDTERLPGAIQSHGNSTTTTTPTVSDRGRGGDRLWLLGALATVAFGSIRLGYAQTAYRSVWKRWQPRSDDPNRDVERALARMEYHLESAYRPREDGETHQQYFERLRAYPLASLDERTWRVLDVYQRSRYGSGVDRETADEAIRLVDELVRD